MPLFGLNNTLRNNLILSIPAAIVIITFYWFRKKKKLRYKGLKKPSTIMENSYSIVLKNNKDEDVSCIQTEIIRETDCNKINSSIVKELSDINCLKNQNDNVEVYIEAENVNSANCNPIDYSIVNELSDIDYHKNEISSFPSLVQIEKEDCEISNMTNNNNEGVQTVSNLDTRNETVIHKNVTDNLVINEKSILDSTRSSWADEMDNLIASDNKNLEKVKEIIVENYKQSSEEVTKINVSYQSKVPNVIDNKLTKLDETRERKTQLDNNFISPEFIDTSSKDENLDISRIYKKPGETTSYYESPSHKKRSKKNKRDKYTIVSDLNKHESKNNSNCDIINNISDLKTTDKENSHEDRFEKNNLTDDHQRVHKVRFVNDINKKHDGVRKTFTKRRNHDSQSEDSNDSGKGSSEQDIITISDENVEIRRHTLNFPSDLVGLLIGKNGKNVNEIVTRCHVDLSMKPKLFDSEHQLCVLKGTKENITLALNLLRRRFREINFDDYDISRETSVFDLKDFNLTLNKNEINDVIVSSVYSPCEFFIQLYKHPSYRYLKQLMEIMDDVYLNTETIIPQLPRPVEQNVVCAAPLNGGWYRAVVMKSYQHLDECDILFADFGGYQRVACYKLKQLRSDFLTLPFQSIKCKLAGVSLLKNPPETAVSDVEMLLHGQITTAKVVDEIDLCPHVDLFITIDDSQIHINEEVIKRNVACKSNNCNENNEECEDSKNVFDLNIN